MEGILNYYLNNYCKIYILMFLTLRLQNTQYINNVVILLYNISNCFTIKQLALIINHVSRQLV